MHSTIRANLMFDFQKKADAHNEILSSEIKAKFENRVLNGIGGNYLGGDSFVQLFISSKVAALDEVCYAKSFISIVSQLFVNVNI